MLQPAATSANSSLALTAGTPGGTAENLEIPEGFAALLALGMTTGAEGEAELAMAPEEIAAALRQGGKASGNASGKILPVLLPEGDAAAAALAAGLEIPPEKPADASDDAATRTDAAAEPTLSILVAVPVPTISLKLPQVEVADPEQPAAARTQAPAAPQLVAAPLATTIAQLGAAPGKAIELPTETPTLATPKAAAALPQQPTDKQLDVPVLRVVRPQEEAAEPVLAETPTINAAKAVPDSAAPPAKVAVQLSVNLPAKPEAAQPGKGEAKAPVQPAVTTLPAGEAAVAESPTIPVTEQPAATAIKPAPLRPNVVATIEPRGSAAEPSAARTLPSALEPGVGDPMKPIAAELQPVLALREAQPVSQAGTTAPAVATVTTAPHDRHDFATLVDRLVEARDAAVPQAVRAAITHSEFGQVSLRFQQDDARLTVSMTSADPDFAPAVQAAAAVQSSATADNGTTGQRQDAQGQQQSGSSASSQAQSQGSARGGERERGESARQPNSNQPAQAEDEARPGRRGGIYA